MSDLNSGFKTYIDNTYESISAIKIDFKENKNKQELRSFEKEAFLYINLDESENGFKYANDYCIHNYKYGSSYSDNFEDFKALVLSLSDVAKRNLSMSEILDYLSSNHNEIYKKIKDAITDSDAEGSSQSLLHLIKYWPLINRYPNTYLYIEQSTQLWAMIYKSPKKGTLNFVVSDNGEIRFSFIKQGHGLSKFTGRARISKKIHDYKHIRFLFEMMSFD